MLWHGRRPSNTFRSAAVLFELVSIQQLTGATLNSQACLMTENLFNTHAPFALTT